MADIYIIMVLLAIVISLLRLIAILQLNTILKEKLV